MHARIRAGDPEAFRELFRDHAQLVYRHAVRTTGDWAAAEDIVSLTFLEAWRLREKLRDEGDSPRPWLMGIAVNVLRNTGRAVRRHERALARMPLRDVLPDFADELVGRITDSEELAAAKTAMAQLRKGEREVFALCVWSGLGYAEAAEALGVPVGTVRSRLSRARTRLRMLTDGELRRRRKKTEPVWAGGQVQGGRVDAARSNEERTR
ncbi:RNA polymerase sigma factor [Streptomyces clavifer]|uniref:RNA polymerase sigma factor n=1 Tax=Streptomyces clavifer TaxID=68188 RepID=UPI0030905D6A|nr:RNA polymerase sigma factor [Streptomyces clavifer]